MSNEMNQQIFAKLKLQNHATGFTLIELLVSMVITGIVITLGSSALVAILNLNQKSETEIDLRMELNRAMDFIADDVKEANNISTSVPPSWTSWTVPANYTGVLFLTKPSGTPSGSQVAYYKRQKPLGATTPEWRGPEIIYRATLSNNGGDALVDSIKTGGFPTPTVAASRQVNLSLTGQICTPPVPGNICTNPQTLTVSTQVFARAEINSP